MLGGLYKHSDCGVLYKHSDSMHSVSVDHTMCCTDPYFPVVAHHLVWEGRGEGCRGVPAVVLRRVQQALGRTVLPEGVEQDRTGASPCRTCFCNLLLHYRALQS